MYKKCCAALQRPRAEDDKISTWDMKVVTMFPIHSKIGHGLGIHLGKLVNKHGKNELIPVYLENNIFNFNLNREVKSTETNSVNNAQQSGKRVWQRESARNANENCESRSSTNW